MFTGISGSILFFLGLSYNIYCSITNSGPIARIPFVILFLFMLAGLFSFINEIYIQTGMCT